jgi:hypothetical protein
MTDLERALETSALLAEKVASARAPSQELREKQALADFAAFGLFKQAALDPNLMRGLMFGAGVGLPALGVGHLLLRDARHQGESLVRDARNQALLTAAGVGGMQALGGLLKRPEPPVSHNVNVTQQPLSDEQKLAAAVMVDDVLEQALESDDADVKHAALVELIRHRSEAAALLRNWRP